MYLGSFLLVKKKAFFSCVSVFFILLRCTGSLNGYFFFQIPVELGKRKKRISHWLTKENIEFLTVFTSRIVLKKRTKAYSLVYKRDLYLIR